MPWIYIYRIFRIQTCGNFLYQKNYEHHFVLSQEYCFSSVCIIFFVCFLSDSSPILDHCPEGSLTHPMWNHNVFILTLSWRRSLSYRDHSFDLEGKSVDCFLYDSDFRDERVLSFTFWRTVKGLRNISLRHCMTEVYWEPCQTPKMKLFT